LGFACAGPVGHADPKLPAAELGGGGGGGEPTGAGSWPTDSC